MGEDKFQLKSEQLKKMSNYIIVMVAGLAILIWAATMDKPEAPSDSTNLPLVSQGDAPAVAKEGAELDGTERALEAKVEQVLGLVEDAGKVKVTVRLENSGEKVLAVNGQTSNRETIEKDTQGGTRTTTEVTKSDEVVMVKNNGVETPVVLKASRPELNGVLVVAEGAVDEGVKLKLTRTVQTLLGVPAHKVSVVPMKGGE